jgi:sterol desaturase/sphingolipid hydroxylase (fatty acid hydroxylase superfamily)
MYLVLIPPFGVAAIAVVTAPFAWLAARLLGDAAGWMMLVTTSLYVVLYELSHLAYHLPETSWIGRRQLVRVLREHHRTHHDPRLMQRWNFNVTVPLFDWLHGTIASSEPSANRGSPARRGASPVGEPHEAPRV